MISFIYVLGAASQRLGLVPCGRSSCLGLLSKGTREVLCCLLQLPDAAPYDRAGAKKPRRKVTFADWDVRWEKCLSRSGCTASVDMSQNALLFAGGDDRVRQQGVRCGLG